MQEDTMTIREHVKIFNKICRDKQTLDAEIDTLILLFAEVYRNHGAYDEEYDEFVENLIALRRAKFGKEN